jgi:hypothetical protein
MKLMLTKTPPEDIKQNILPVVYNALDADSSQVQVKTKLKFLIQKLPNSFSRNFV